MLIIKLIFFTYFNLYAMLWRYASIREIVDVAKGVSLSSIFGFAIIFTQPSLEIDIRVLIIDFLFTSIFIGSSRLAYRAYRDIFSEQRNKQKKQKDTLIIGAGNAAAMIIKQSFKLNDVNIIGCLDDDTDINGQIVSGVPVLGKISEISTILSRFALDEIIISIPSANGKRIREIVAMCTDTSVPFRIVPGFNEIIDGRVTINQVREVKIEDLLRRAPINLDNRDIADYINNNNVLISGAGGSIGSELARQIARFNPRKLYVMGHGENSIYNIQIELRKHAPFLEVIPVICDMRNQNKINNLFSRIKPDVVFHAAAHKHVPLMEDNPDEAITNNVSGTYNIASAADQYNCQKFVMISTDKATNPTNIMGASKRIAEQLILAKNETSKTSFVIVRFGNVLGSRGSVVPLFKKQILEGGPITVTHPDVTRYFMTIPEAVQLVLQAAGMAHGGEKYVLDMGEPIKISDLAKDLIKLSGLTLGVDIDINYIGMRPGEKMYEELFSNDENLKETSNTQIMVAEPEIVNQNLLITNVKKLIDIANQEYSNSLAIKKHVKIIVPDYEFKE
jgi:FlaA1/EpsC-like NDP-sugar epimerase